MGDDDIRKMHDRQIKELGELSRKIAEAVENAAPYDELGYCSRELVQKIESLRQSEEKRDLEHRERQALLQEAREKFIASQRSCRQSEEKFLKTFNFGPVIMMLSTAAEGRYMEVSDHFLRVTEYARDEVIGHTSIELGIWANPADRRKIMEIIRDKGRVADEEVLFKSRSGRVYTALFYTEAVSIGGTPYLVSAAIDVTERRKTEEALRASEERYDELAAQSRTVAWEVDAAGIYTYISHVAEHVFGYKPDEIIGRLHFYDLHPEEGRNEFKEAAFDVFRKKERFVGLENRVEKKDGSVIWVSTNGIPLLNADGSLRGYRGSDNDITERKQYAMERERLIAELQHALADVKVLSGLIPICSHCKKIRDDQGYWKQIESFILEHSEAVFSHGICPECMDKHYSDLVRDQKQKK